MRDEGRDAALDAQQRAARRRRDLERVVVPRVRETFDRRPELRSALLVVAQYWNDNANDEVHGHIVFSCDDVPRWPHECEWPRAGQTIEPCTQCDSSGPYFALPYENATFRAWEAYCKEGANQEQGLAEAFLPYALITARDDGALAIDPVGEPVRPWLDIPDEPAADDTAVDSLLELVHSAPDDPSARHVLADALLERGDPRGEYLAIVLADAPTPAALERAEVLFAQHGRRWLGPLARIAPVGATRFSLGFVESVAAYFPAGTDLSWIAEAAEWSTVRSLTFLPESKHHLGPSMKNLRSVGPLADDGLLELVGAEHAWRIERLHIAPRHVSAMALLCEPPVVAKLPRLRQLFVSGILTSPVHLRALAATPLWNRLDALHVAGMFPNPEHGLEPALLHVWLTTDMPLPPELALGMRGNSGEPSGAWLHLRRRAPGDSRLTAQMRVDAIGAPYGPRHLCGAIAALEPDVRERIAEIELARSRWLHPTEADLAMIRDTTDLPATIVERKDLLAPGLER